MSTVSGLAAAWDRISPARGSRRSHASANDVKEAEAQASRYHADVKYRAMQYTRVAKLAQGDTVTKQLAEEGMLSRAGKPFTPMAIRRLMLEEVPA